MRQIRFGWLLLVTPLALGAGACGDTEGRKPSAAASGGAGGETAGNAAAGTQPTAGAEAKGGTFAAGGELSAEPGGAGGRAGGEAGAPELGGAGAAGADAGGPCGAPSSLAILGDYAEPNGDELWLRDSGKAVTLTRVPSGKPVLAKPPRLWRVVQACPSESALLLQNAAGDFTRLDYFQGATSLTACLSLASASSAEQARQLAAANRTNTIDGGCNAGPWTRFVKGDK